jgi:hypothetical protein
MKLPLGPDNTYDGYTVVVDVCLLVKLVLELSVLLLRGNATRVQTCWLLESRRSFKPYVDRRDRSSRGIRTGAVDAGADGDHYKLSARNATL